MRPGLSVALATYNGARFLREQLESIYEPCGVTLEVVACDDGSTDGTRAILQDYARRRGLRDITDGTRRGLVQNFARVLAHCRGECIALADQDDIWQPGRLDFLRQEIGGHDAVYSVLEKILLPDGTLAAWAPPPGFIDFVARHGDGRPTRQLIASNWVVSHTMLVSRRAVDAALPIPAGQAYHDAWLALAAAAGRGIRCVTPNPTIYRQHAASHTAALPSPAPRRWLGLPTGLPRAVWESKCRGEIARLESCERAPFLAAEDRAFAAALRRYYQRGLRRGLDLRTGFAAMSQVAYFQFHATRRLRWNFILRGFVGGV